MLIKNIMKSDVKTCAADASVGAAARVMARHHCGIVPIVDADHKLLGVVTDRDICLAMGTRIRYPDELPVAEVMTTKVYTCSPDDDEQKALTVMTDHAVRRLPVTTATGRLAGIISIDDLLLRAGSHPGAAVSDQAVMESLKAMAARAVAA